MKTLIVRRKDGHDEFIDKPDYRYDFQVEYNGISIWKCSSSTSKVAYYPNDMLYSVKITED